MTPLAALLKAAGIGRPDIRKMAAATHMLVEDGLLDDEALRHAFSRRLQDRYGGEAAAALKVLDLIDEDRLRKLSGGPGEERRPGTSSPRGPTARPSVRTCFAARC